MEAMNKFFALLLASVLLCSSWAGSGYAQQNASLEDIYDSGHWVTRPSGAVIPVLGIAGRRRNRDEAIAEALADAARRVALYHGLHGESASVLNQGSGNLDYFSAFDYRLIPLNAAEQYTGDLIFDREKDVLEKDGAVYVRVQYSGVSGVPPYETALEDGIPDWVKNYGADVPGFLTAVAYSKNKGSPQKTYQASYENAIVSLLPRLSSKVVDEAVDTPGGKVTRSTVQSSGDLENIMILETWLDKKARIVWTLLVAKQKLY